MILVLTAVAVYPAGPFQITPSVEMKNRCMIDTVPETYSPKYVIVQDSANDTLKKTDTDSLVAASSAISDSTKANAPHGIDSGRIPISIGDNLWGMSSITDTGNYCRIRNDLYLDSIIKLGAGQDFEILYDDTDGILNPRAAGIGNIKINGNVYPYADDTYYVGKNDDDSPFAYKGIILKDQTDGKYYRVELNGGSLTVVDLTD